MGSEMCIRDCSTIVLFFFQAEDGIRDRSPSRGLGDVYKRQILKGCNIGILLKEKYAETGALMAGHLKNTGMTDQTEYLSDITARTIEQYDLLAMEQSE